MKKEENKFSKIQKKEKLWEGRDKSESYKVLQNILQYCGIECWRIKGIRYDSENRYEDEILTAILPSNSKISNIYPELKELKCYIAFIYRPGVCGKMEIPWGGRTFKIFTKNKPSFPTSLYPYKIFQKEGLSEKEHKAIEDFIKFVFNLYRKCINYDDSKKLINRKSDDEIAKIVKEELCKKANELTCNEKLQEQSNSKQISKLSKIETSTEKGKIIEEFFATKYDPFNFKYHVYPRIMYEKIINLPFPVKKKEEIISKVKDIFVSYIKNEITYENLIQEFAKIEEEYERMKESNLPPKVVAKKYFAYISKKICEKFCY
jgi:hypothetical protein